MIVLALLIGSLLLRGLLLFSLLSCQLDLDPIHAPHECNLALSGDHDIVPDLVEVVVIPLKSPLGKNFTVLLSHPKSHKLYFILSTYRYPFQDL